MLEVVENRKFSLVNGELFHIVCLGLFLFSLPLLGRIYLSYLLGFWLLGTIIQKRVWLQQKMNWRSSKLYRLFFLVSLLFVAVLFSSIFYSSNTLKGFQRFDAYLSLLVIPIGLFLIKPFIQKYYRFLLWIFVAGNTIASLICWGDSLFEYYNEGIWNPYYVNFSNFLHPSYFALYLAFSVLIIWQEKIRNRKETVSLHTIFYSILIVLFSLTIVFLSSKAGIFAFSGMLFVLLGIEIFCRRNILINTGWICLVVIATCFVVKNNQRMQKLSESVNSIQSGESKTTWTSTTCRFYIWESALASLKDDYILGHGIGDSKEALIREYKKKHYSTLWKSRFDAHNQYLEILLICGLGGLFVLLFLLLFTFRYALKEKNTLMLGFIVLMMIHLAVETMFNKAHGVMFYSFFIHFLWIKMDEHPFFTILWKRIIKNDEKPMFVLNNYSQTRIKGI